MKVTNPGDRVTLAFSQETVDAGAVVDVPDDVGAQLVAQGWTEPKPTKTKPAAAEQED